ncbi:hypothetical protein L1987_67878 [Smallanthus sonchifolius]|uniref:Uncharacterized protein n=1 Tax=Smallanthus sonchifolius TaxID=185202 RepID=A0ACB9B599_9ASTR|nr:hypothetical protein L1987_67878 [Smallanthus sonchifolius]
MIREAPAAFAPSATYQMLKKKPVGTPQPRRQTFSKGALGSILATLTSCITETLIYYDEAPVSVSEYFCICIFLLYLPRVQ